MRPNPLLLLVFLAACADAPDLGVTPAHGRDGFPDLVPLDPLLAQAASLDQTGRNLPALTQSALARAAALRARAAALRGPVIDRATRTRMQAGIDTTALQ